MRGRGMSILVCTRLGHIFQLNDKACVPALVARVFVHVYESSYVGCCFVVEEGSGG